MDELHGVRVTFSGNSWRMYDAVAKVRDLLTQTDEAGKDADCTETSFDASRSRELTVLWMKGGQPNTAATDQVLREIIWEATDDFVTVIIDRFIMTPKSTRCLVTRPQEYEKYLARKKAKADQIKQMEEETRAAEAEAEAASRAGDNANA